MAFVTEEVNSRPAGEGDGDCETKCLTGNNRAGSIVLQLEGTPLRRLKLSHYPLIPFSFVGATSNSLWLTVPRVK